MVAKASYRKKVFNENYDLIMKHIESSGSKRLPSDCPETRRLSNWMRRQFRRNVEDVPDDEKAKLDRLREIYGCKGRNEDEEEKWERFFKRMQKYKEEYHTLVISRKDKVNRQLYHWVARQRRLAKEERLAQERRQKLVQFGFDLHNQP